MSKSSLKASDRYRSNGMTATPARHRYRNVVIDLGEGRAGAALPARAWDAGRMTEKLVVIGGDAGGMSAATQARRLKDAEALDIAVLEQGPEVSYSACGIPYWVGDQVSDRDALIARVPSWFESKDIDVHLGTRAESVDLE